MEHEQVSCGSICDRLPPRLSSKYPWFLVQNLEDEENIGNQFLSTLHNPSLKYECKIPEFQGRRIAGCFHGWLILSNGDRLWSLCNPLTSEVKHLPPLTLKDGDDKSIGECCLTAPPDDPTSVLLLIRCDKPTFVFCRLERWTEMSYANQLKKLTCDGELVNNITLCDGNIYVLSNDNCVGKLVIQVKVLVKDREVMIKLLMFGAQPSFNCSPPYYSPFLKGYGTDLFYIKVAVDEETTKICDVYFYKLDMTRVKREEIDRLKNWDLTGVTFDDFQLYLNCLGGDLDISRDLDFIRDLDIIGDLWEEMDDLKDAIFYVDLDRYATIVYNPSIGSKLGGYIHIRDDQGEILYLYHVKDRTIVSVSMPSGIESTTHIYMWEGRLLDDHGDDEYICNSKQEEDDEMVVTSIAAYDEEVELNESCLLMNIIPFDILKMIMERCVGVDYMNFRATCKQCHLAAPVIKWSEETSITRLHNYSLNSPWLMVVNKNRKTISFKDPISGVEYLMKNSHVSIERDMYCSMFGWMLFYSNEFGCLVFFNPFTRELRQLPEYNYIIRCLCFSAPPTSPDCIVVGFRETTEELEVCFHLVNREANWRVLKLGGGDPHSIRSSTFHGQDLYALSTKGELIVFRGLFEGKCCLEILKAKAPLCCIDSNEEYHLMKYDEHHLLLVIVSQFGESVELFKWTRSKDEWEEIDEVGKHTIYICGTTSLCVEAKTAQLENKIYFPQLDMKTDKILCYPLKTAKENHMYYTYNGKTIQATFEDFDETKHPLNAHVWIEPTWC